MGQVDQKWLVNELSPSVGQASSPSRSRLAQCRFWTTRWRAAFIAGSGALVTFVSPRLARAEPAGATFLMHWNAPAACPDGSVVTSEIARLLGRSPGQPSDRPVSLRADVSLTAAGGYAVQIVVSTAEVSGERRIESHTCEQAAQATALVASLAIDPDAVAAHAAPEAAAVVSGTVGSAPPRASAQPTADSTSSRARRPGAPTSLSDQRARQPTRVAGSPTARVAEPPLAHLELGGNVGSEIGVLPKPTLRLGAALDLSWRRLYLEVAGAYALSQFAAAPARSGQGANIQLDTLLFRSCAAVVTGAFELAPCAALEAGLFDATGVGISSPEQGRHPWLATLVGPRLAWHPSPAFVLALDLEGGVALVRPRFQIGGNDPGFVYQPAFGLGAATLGALVRVR
jgi:hypothetical protein